MSLDNAANVFILYGCSLSKERSSMRIVAATTDEEMLHTIIGAQILGGTIHIMTLEDGLSGYSICVFLFMMFLVFLFVFFSNGGKLKYFFLFTP